MTLVLEYSMQPEHTVHPGPPELVSLGLWHVETANGPYPRGRMEFHFWLGLTSERCFQETEDTRSKSRQHGLGFLTAIRRLSAVTPTTAVKTTAPPLPKLWWRLSLSFSRKCGHFC